MKYIDEYRNSQLAKGILEKIHRISTRELTLMEICGGHTAAIHRFGLKQLLPEQIRLLSGPGCPVCVSGLRFIDTAIAYSRLKNVTIATYGDLMRVPGTEGSLELEKAKGAHVEIVYSPLQALEMARANHLQTIIFLGIGFETTSPASAITLQKAKQEGLHNFLILSAHKVMPPAMTALIDENATISGYLCPGHVSVITGTEMYAPFPEKYGVGCVVSGFEPLDILQSVYMLVRQAESGKPQVEIQYTRAVKPQGNEKAQAVLREVFSLRDDTWRGLGVIRKSGYKLSEAYEVFDAEKTFPIDVPVAVEHPSCICGLILKGLKNPGDCLLFRKSCTPAHPVGACMVSAEGTCHTYYKFPITHE